MKTTGGSELILCAVIPTTTAAGWSFRKDRRLTLQTVINHTPAGHLSQRPHAGSPSSLLRPPPWFHSPKTLLCSMSDGLHFHTSTLLRWLCLGVSAVERGSTNAVAELQPVCKSLHPQRSTLGSLRKVLGKKSLEERRTLTSIRC